MGEASVYLSGRLDPCPERFNAAAHCLSAGEDAAEALIAVDPATGVARHWSFGEVRDRVARAAGALRAAGVRQGDRVVLLLGDVPDFPFAYFGAIAAGAVATPLSSQLSAAEIVRILEDAGSRVVVAGDEFDLPDGTVARLARSGDKRAASGTVGGARKRSSREDGSGAARACRPGGPAEKYEPAREAVKNPSEGLYVLTASDLAAGSPVTFADTRPDDSALLVFTSGSSGRPKGVLHAHRAFWARRSMHAGWHDIRAGDRVMHAGAFNWTFTLGVALADTWSVGATAILNQGARGPEVWPGLARAFRPTIFAAAPAVFRRVLKYGDGLAGGFASLRHAVTAGEALSPAIGDAWESATGKPLLEALGMSEVSTYISTPPDRAAAAGHAGWPQPGRHVAVLDDDGRPVPRGAVGALAIHRSDPGLMLGYWNRPDLTAAAFKGDWFVTGDLVTMRADGAIAHAGRADDQMNAQGYRVDPGEVEAALISHAAVTECGVTALPVSEGLSVIAAWVVGEAGREALLTHARERLAAYKIPREWFRASALPHSANGKLLRRELPRLPRTPL